MKKTVVVIGFLLMGCLAEAQTPLNIDSCYTWARQQYPLVKQKNLIEKSRDYTVSNASKGYLPQFSITGQATHQSAVTAIPDIKLPGINLNIPTPTKDQFNVHGEVDQIIYDGGAIKQQKQLQETAADIQQQNLEVQLYTLRDRINQLFFGVMLIHEQLKQNHLLQKDLQNSIDKMQSAVSAGSSLPSNLDELQANLLMQQQNEISLQSSNKSYLDMLSLFINRPLNEATVLETPPAVVLTNHINRPELLQFDIQKKSNDIQEKLINVAVRPKLSAFIQGGYALPGLDMFDANPAFYYIGGVHLNWSLNGLYTMKNQKQILSLNRQTTDVQKETFLFNTTLTLNQQKNDINRLQQLIEKDNDIIAKRVSVTQTAKVQMEEGAITIHEYLSQLNAEDQAKQNLLLHQVQLLMGEYNYQNTSGN